MCKHPCFVGLFTKHKTEGAEFNHELVRRVRAGEDFLYADHAYFQRGHTSFRLIRGELHLTKLLDRPADRLGVWNPPIKDYRRGSRVVVIPPSRYQSMVYGSEGWVDETLERLRAVTDRPVVVKTDKAIPLETFLADAWAVVTFASAAGVSALLSGVPVFAGPYCPCLPVSSGSVEDIERPVLHDRLPWLRSLAYCQWGATELDRINWEDYQYL